MRTELLKNSRNRNYVIKTDCSKAVTVLQTVHQEKKHSVKCCNWGSVMTECFVDK